MTLGAGRVAMFSARSTYLYQTKMRVKRNSWQGDEKLSIPAEEAGERLESFENAMVLQNLSLGKLHA